MKATQINSTDIKRENTINMLFGGNVRKIILKFWAHILETSYENLRKTSHLTTIMDNIWGSTNQI